MDLKTELSKRFDIDYELHRKNNILMTSYYNPDSGIVPDYLYLLLEKSKNIPLEEKVSLMRYYDSVLIESLMPTIIDEHELMRYVCSAESMLNFVDSIAFKYSKIHGSTLDFVKNNASHFKSENFEDMNYVDLYNLNKLI